MKTCPNCQSKVLIKAGIVNQKQRYKCKECNYFFTVNKQGKSIDNYYITKGLQLYIEGLSFRQIERLIGVSHVTISHWVKKYGINKVEPLRQHPTYRILDNKELSDFFKTKSNLKNLGFIISELGDKYMLISWERFKK